MKKSLVFVGLFLVLGLSVFVSAGFFDFWKSTGNVVSGDYLILEEGSQKVTCSNHTVSIEFISASEVKLNVGGSFTPFLGEGDSFEISGYEPRLKVADIMFNSKDGISKVQLIEEFLIVENDEISTGVNCGDNAVVVKHLGLDGVNLEIRSFSNSEVTPLLNEGDIYTLTDGSNLTISDIMFNSKGGISKVEVNITNNDGTINSNIVEEGQFVTLEDKQVSITFISSLEVILNFLPNSEITPLLKEGEKYTLSDENTLTISEILPDASKVLISLNKPMPISAPEEVAVPVEEPIINESPIENVTPIEAFIAPLEISGAISLPNLYWADSNGDRIGNEVRKLAAVGDTVYLVIKQTGLSENETLLMEIWEDDVFFDDKVRVEEANKAINGIVDAQGGINAPWTITQEDYDSSFDKEEFVFIVNSEKSERLTIFSSALS